MKKVPQKINIMVADEIDINSATAWRRVNPDLEGSFGYMNKSLKSYWSLFIYISVKSHFEYMTR